ncbi:MAG: Cobalt-zinc-cadmium resistance protein [Holophagaceae bacterium]|nr:Cobalt-zinc-cadmium resistance protein [Holophagaceae bacterium]
MVRLTGFTWLDPILALGVAALLGWTGFKLVGSSSQALLDMEDPELLEQILSIVNRIRPVDLIAIHDLKTLRSGRHTHVDIHLVVPEFYTIQHGHELLERVQEQIIEEAALQGEFNTHLDPCQRAWCPQCGVEPCPIRIQPHENNVLLTVAEAVAPGDI